MNTQPHKLVNRKLANRLLVLVVIGQVIYYSAVIYGLREKTSEVYLTCVGGTVRPVLVDGTFPYVKTDNGKHFKCLTTGEQNA